jgi:hypothetical protein
MLMKHFHLVKLFFQSGTPARICTNVAHVRRNGLLDNIRMQIIDTNCCLLFVYLVL